MKGFPRHAHTVGRGLGGVGEDDAEAGLISAHAARLRALRKVLDIKPEKLQPLEYRLDGDAVNLHGIARAKPFANFPPHSFLFGDFEELWVGAFNWQPFFKCEQRHEDLMPHFLIV